MAKEASSKTSSPEEQGAEQELQTEESAHEATPEEEFEQSLVDLGEEAEDDEPAGEEEPAEGEVELTEEGEEEEGEATEAKAPEEGKPAEEAKPAEAKPEEPEAAKPTQGPEKPTEGEPEKTREQLIEDQQKWFAEAEQQLADTTFKLEDEVAEGFDTGVPEVISKLMARTFLQSTQAASMAIMQVLPQAIQQLRQNDERATREEDAFFSTWTKLDRKNEAHRNTIQQIAVSHRTAHPQMPAEEFIKQVGATAMVALGIPFDQPAEEEPAPKPNPPVAKGGPGGAKTKPLSPFDEFVEESLVEDID